MTTCLGINTLHDTSAALLVDGELVAAAEEERFNRTRHTTEFPHQAIDYCLAAAGLELAAVDVVATSFDFRKFAVNFSPFEHNTIAGHDTSLAGRCRIAWDNFRCFLRSHRLLRRFLGGKRLIQAPHHLTHAYCAYYLGGKRERNILTLDGRGEREATCLYLGRDGRIDCLHCYPVDQSLGHLYTYVTYLCGLYRGIGQEGKTMGLAPYGGPRFDFSEILSCNGDRYRIRRDAMRGLRPFRAELGVLTEDSRDLAWAVQEALNRAAVFLARRCHEKTGLRDFGLAGGVALNAVTNGEILEQEFVDDLFVFPAANDAGAAIGAALYALGQQGPPPAVRQQELVYLGSEYSNEEIAAVLRRRDLSFSYHEEIAAVGARLLAEGKILGWFQGRMEFGPRALGNRSILADPRRPETKDRINEKVKMREPWRPFAPAILYDRMGEYFDKVVAAPYMIVNFQVKENKREEIAAAVHIDGSARVQTVTPESNPRFYRLIELFSQESGTPVLVNTSFNTRGEPIVRTPEDALDCFFGSGLDAVCLGNFLLTKTD